MFPHLSTPVPNVSKAREISTTPILSTRRPRGKTTAWISEWIGLALVCIIAIPISYRALSPAPSRYEVLMTEGKKQLTAGQSRLRELDRLYAEIWAERGRIAASIAHVLSEAPTLQRRNVLTNQLSQVDSLLERLRITQETLKSEVSLLELSLSTSRLLQKIPDEQDQERLQSIMGLAGELRDRQRQQLLRHADTIP